jgi:hypothetical protein
MRYHLVIAALFSIACASEFTISPYRPIAEPCPPLSATMSVFFATRQLCTKAYQAATFNGQCDIDACGNTLLTITTKSVNGIMSDCKVSIPPPQLQNVSVSFWGGFASPKFTRAGIAMTTFPKNSIQNNPTLEIDFGSSLDCNKVLTGAQFNSTCKIDSGCVGSDEIVLEGRLPHFVGPPIWCQLHGVDLSDSTFHFYASQQKCV